MSSLRDWEKSQEDQVALSKKWQPNASVEALHVAARHPEAIVRVAAAASAKSLTNILPSLATELLNDSDPGVRNGHQNLLKVITPRGSEQE